MNDPSKADPRTDEALVSDLSRGDESAFTALYFRHRDWVVRLAYRFTGDQEDALDVLQETFAYVLRRAPSLHLTARMTTFLYPAVKNLSLSIRRKRRTSTLTNESLFTELPAPESAPNTSRVELSALLAQLPDTHREVLLMRFVDDMALEEIGQAIGIPLGTVKSRLHNALSTLRVAEGLRERLL